MSPPTSEPPQPGQPDPGQPEPPGETAWTAWDVADAYGWGLATARFAIGQWQDKGVIEQCGTDKITGAALYPAERIRAARLADLGEQTNGPADRHEPHSEEPTTREAP